jgi:protein TonB
LRASRPGCSESHQAPSEPNDANPIDRLPQAVTKVPPAYPDKARDNQVQGTVQVEAHVCEHGRVIETKIAQSIPLLDESAQDAVDQWTFVPASSRGHAIGCWVTIPIKFSLH